jgi:hypothetical protein
MRALPVAHRSEPHICCRNTPIAKSKDSCILHAEYTLSILVALNFYAAAAQTGGMRAARLSFHDQTTNSIDLWNGPKSKRQKRKLNRQTRDISRNFRLRGRIELPTKSIAI